MSGGAEASWSEWLDFDRTNVEATPELPGVYAMHTAMKVLYIGGATNLRQSLLELLSHPCVNKAKRFHYMLTPSPDAIRDNLLKEYHQKHGKLPQCMEEA